MDKNKDKTGQIFVDLVKPLIKYLNDNQHPHATIFITTDSAQIFEGKMCYFDDKYIRD